MRGKVKFPPYQGLMAWACWKTAAAFTLGLLESPGERCASAPWRRARSVCGCLTTSMTFRLRPSLIPAMSAWLSIKDRAGLRNGETVLILGATGVAGQLAIQVARKLGAKRIVAAGRNLDALASEKLDGVVSLAQDEDAIREAFAVEARKGIDVVIDYLWGRPTELLLEALAKGFNPDGGRPTRLVEIGQSAGPAITLPGATLRSIDLTLMGSGFGAVSLDRVLEAIPTLFSMASAGALRVVAEPVPLAEVEAAWNRKESGKRIVFTI